MVSSRMIYAVIAILMIVIATVEASGYGDALGFIVQTGSSSFNCKGSIADCMAEEEEFELDSEISRRILASKKYVSYGAMRKNNVPCSRRGASYYNCKRGAQANPYSRGCSTITRFHAKEYPGYDKKVFPYNTGYCQRGSDVKYDDSMNLRNILWLAPLPNKSTPGWLAPDDLGTTAVDVNYLNVGAREPDYQHFIC